MFSFLIFDRMRKEAKEFKMKKALNGSDHKSQSMKLSYCPLPDPIGNENTHWENQHISSQAIGFPNNGAPYFDMQRFLNDCANGEVDLPAPLIELISNDINKISKQFSEELQKGYLNKNHQNGRSKHNKLKQIYHINNDQLPNTKSKNN